jgi:hypothetical protein
LEASRTKIALSFLIIGVLVGAAIVYAVRPSFTTYISGGGMASTAGFILFRDGVNYFAQNGLTGNVTVGTDFTDIYEYAEANLPAEGGIIHLKPGYFEGHIVIKRDGVTLEGETSFEDIPTDIPDNPPTILNGSVIKVLESGVDAIHIQGQRYGIVIRDLGIWFNVSSTGNGITTDMGQAYTVTHCTIQNVKILNHDKTHYALQMCNFLHWNVEQIMAWGGPLINIFGNKDGFQGGNSNFQGLYGYIRWDLGAISYGNGPYPIFIHKNDSLTSDFTNLMHFTRLQINNPWHQSSSYYYVMTVWGCRYSTFEDLDLEGVEANNIQVGSCVTLTFSNPYLWAMTSANAYLNVAADNEYIYFVNGYLNEVLDSNYTDLYTGCKIVGGIQHNSKANFADLPGNSGYGQIEDGQSSVTISATWIGQNYGVFITPLVAADNQEPIRVSSMLSEPANKFTVRTASGNQTTSTVGFYWEVRWKGAS